ncbi:MAG: transcriptional regulator with XRE-family HTH domain [Nitrospinales bacterium]|jgi:transcriptional regulator with XRE-family HTH domain
MTFVLEETTLSSRIKFARKKAGYNQEEIAEKLLITKQQFSKYEKEKSIPPSDKLLKISQLCEVNPGWLLSGEGNPF